MKPAMVRVRVLGRQGSRGLYGTRVMTAGDEFELPRQAAQTLAAIGRVQIVGGEPQPAPEPKPAPPPPPKPPEPEPNDDEDAPPHDRRSETQALQQEAHALGIAVDGRWGAARLQAEIRRARRGT